MPGSNYSVMVVDDNRDYRNLMCHYLADFPCEITHARDGEEAVECFEENEFDLVIMDIIMPLMDGVDAISVIREMEIAQGRKATPILSISAESSDETVEDCINAGTSRVIIKPVSRQGLLDAMHELLGIETDE